MLISSLKENISFRFSEFTQRLLQLASQFIFNALRLHDAEAQAGNAASQQHVCTP